MKIKYQKWVTNPRSSDISHNNQQNIITIESGALDHSAILIYNEMIVVKNIQFDVTMQHLKPVLVHFTFTRLTSSLRSRYT